MNDRLIAIVQDYALLTEYLNELCCAIHNKNLDLPNFVPVMNDELVSAQLEEITKCIREYKKGVWRILSE